MSGRIDFSGIAAQLLARSESFLFDLFPAGKLHGREFSIGDISGEAGDSLKINLDTGIGADFATGQTFSDLIAVYAAHHRIGMGEAAKKLSNGAGEPYRAPPPAQKPKPVTISRPPAGTPAPTCQHARHGTPAAIWCYDDDVGPLHYVARYNTGTGKEIVPWSWDGSRWVAKSYHKPRPLYGLASLLARPGAPVIVVEGEKCVDALRRLSVQRIPVTASGGAGAIHHADWSHLYGRDVLLFPDHDAPGRKAMLELATILVHKTSKLSIIDHEQDDLPEGWDFADTNWTSSELNAWARERIREIRPPDPEPPATPPEPVTRGKPRTKRDGSPPAGAMIDGDTGSAFVSWESLGLQCTSGGMPFPSLSNVQLILANHPELQGRIWYDEFHQRVFSTLFSSEPMEWKDHHDTELTAFIQGKLRIHKIGVQAIQRAVDAYARRNTKNEVKDYLSGLVWDQQPRLAHVMSDGFGAPQNSYSAAVGKCFFTGMVARVFWPGCKHDYMPVFEGDQGAKKSTALSIIGGKWFAEQHEDITRKDFFQNLIGKLLFEISELHAFKRSEVERIKGVISCQTDRYRGSYDRRSMDHPRMCAFAGTTNRDDYVADDTGARRFWPIKCLDVNLDYFEANRDQLFAEAVSRFNRVPIHAKPIDRINADADWWAVDSELARKEVDLRRDEDVWTDPIIAYVKGKRFVTVSEVMEHALGIPTKQHTRSDQMRVSSVLRLLRFVKRDIRVGSRNLKHWVQDNPHDGQLDFGEKGQN